MIRSLSALPDSSKGTFLYLQPQNPRAQIYYASCKIEKIM